MTQYVRPFAPSGQLLSFGPLFNIGWLVTEPGLAYVKASTLDPSTYRQRFTPWTVGGLGNTPAVRLDRRPSFKSKKGPAGDGGAGLESPERQSGLVSQWSAWWSPGSVTIALDQNQKNKEW
jgi:hypothetical protein